MAQSTNASGCDHSTVADVWGAAYAAEAESFFVTLQRTVRAGDENGFASLFHYPLHVYGRDRPLEIRDRKELLRHYHSAVNTDAQAAILSQSPECLFGNGQGVMAADGRVWFQKQPNDSFKVITVNVISEQ